MLRLKNLLITLPLAVGMNAQSPCDWFDHDGDGFIGANTMLYALGSYGVAGGPMDPDSSGVQDLPDLLSFLPYMGNSCDNLDWFDTTSGHIIDLAVVEYAVHTEDLIGIGGTLPAGAVTYQIFALLEDPADHLLGVFGDAETSHLLSLKALGQRVLAEADIGADAVAIVPGAPRPTLAGLVPDLATFLTDSGSLISSSGSV